MPSKSKPVSPPSSPLPALGLVCITASPLIRFRTTTRTNYLKLDSAARHAKLRDLYRSNLQQLLAALEFCAANGIRLYRMTSQLFPMNDLEDGIGAAVLEDLGSDFAAVGARAAQSGIRVVVHPEQFVVLSSDSENVVQNAVKVLAGHAGLFDRMGLPRTSWSMILIHGGKGDRSEALIKRIEALPDNIRLRLALENDEYGYSAQDILEVSLKTGVPMVFDAHHHVIHERLTSYEDASIAHFTSAAARTWPDLSWQIAHLSNGRDGFLDRRHSDLIDQFPSAFLRVPFIEIEAKAKEVAIHDLTSRLELPTPALSVVRDPPAAAAFPDEE